jgi:hypothetical protein
MLFIMHAAVVLDMALQLLGFQGNEAPFPAHLCGAGPYAQPSLRKVLRGIPVIDYRVLRNVTQSS